MTGRTHRILPLAAGLGIWSLGFAPEATLAQVQTLAQARRQAQTQVQSPPQSRPNLGPVPASRASTVTSPGPTKNAFGGGEGNVSAPPAIPPRRDPNPSTALDQQRRERDDLHREDVAAELAQMGLPLKWQAFTLDQLTDWRDRLRAAQSLRTQYGVEADWRMLSLASLTDLRLRAAKAAELSSVYGVRVDWRRYSWVALEALRREVAKLPSTAAGNVTATTANTLARPGSSQDRRRFASRSKDPDAILEPTFAFDTPMVWSRPFGRRGKTDPDAILVPTFVTVPPPPMGPDDLIDPWRPHGPSMGP